MRTYERNGKFGYDIPASESPTGHRVRKLTRAESETEALKLGALALLQLGEEAKATSGEVRRVYTWGEAVIRFAKEKQAAGKVTLKDDLDRFRWLERRVQGVQSYPLTDITRYFINVNVREPLRDLGRSKKTINMYLATFQQVLTLAARDWEDEHGYTWMDHAPTFKKEKLSKKERKRIRYLSKQEALRLIKEVPAHTKPIVRMALATGLRMSNILGMEWEWIDLSRRMLIVPEHVTKTGEPITVPLNSDALEILRSQRFKHPEYVFTYQNRRMKRVNGHAWKKALKRAQIENFRFHDLRHTFASWHIQSGTPIHILQELGGWEDPSMVKKYAHLSADHLQPYAENSGFAQAKCG